MTRNKTIRKFHGGPPNSPHRGGELVSASAQITTFSGPLPHPDVLAKYDQVLPGLADRIASAAEKQMTHRHDLERRHLDGSLGAQQRGQWMALTIVIIGMVTGAILIALGKSTAGFVALLTPLGLVATAFFYSHGGQVRELAQKRRQLEASGQEQKQ